MKEDNNNNDNAERTNKSVWISISAEDYEKLAEAIKKSRRKIGPELLYGWMKNHEREERESCK